MNNQIVKPLRTITALVVILAILASRANSNNKRTDSECRRTPGVTHVVVIENDNVLPSNFTAKRCDNVTITNKDSSEHTIAFGQEESYGTPNDTTKRVLNINQSYTSKIYKVGEYILYDYNQKDVRGTFLVTN